VDPPSLHHQTIRRRLLRLIEDGIKIKSISLIKMLTVWVAIDQAICERIAIIDPIQILIIVDNGMDAKPTKSSEPKGRQERILSSFGRHGPMAQSYHGSSQKYRQHLPLIVVMFRTMTHGADAIMIDVITMVVVEAVGVEKVVDGTDNSASTRTKVRPVLPVSLLT